MLQRSRSRLVGRRVLLTGASRGIGAALAQRLHAGSARVALLGLEAHELARVAADCGGAPWRECDVADADAVDSAVDALAGELGGLDVVVANAGIARQWSVLGGDPATLETTLRVNTLGVAHTIRAATRHIAHPDGYLLVVSSLAAAVHLPLLGAYSASKAAAEALGDTAHLELAPTGARAGVAYFAELDTDMTARGFDTDAARLLLGRRRGAGGSVTPLHRALEALERGLVRRASRIYTPWWVAPVAQARMPVQKLVGRWLATRPVAAALRAASLEDPLFTTTQQGRR